MSTEPTISYTELLKTIKQDIAANRVQAHLSVNKEMIALYWRIGSQILERQDKER
jgi:predicted nuclease of restriction endonuclease-like (RecB) superfamily